MPFFSKVFKSRDATSSKKQAKLNGNGPIAPPKPKWTDAWLRTEVAPEEVQDLLNGCTHEMKARALDTPFLLLPFRPTSDPSAARTFVRNYFGNGLEINEAFREEGLQQELRLAEPMVLCSVMKWCWARLPGGVVTWEAYELFKVGEHDSQLARDAFVTFIPISVESDARTKIIFDFFDLMAAVAAHGKSNGLTGRKLSRYAGWWAFEHSPSKEGFDAGYSTWSRAADATSHLFFAYLRSLSPDSSKGTNGILSLPLSLQTLVQSTEYPPETPTLMQTSTTKVVMIVDAVSPTPFALLRRSKNFEYREDDQALQRFSSFEDPVHALTDECRRVLKCISSTNQSTVSTSKASTSLRDASWSRFEDIGFGGAIEDSDGEDETEAGALAAKRSPPQGMRSAARSRTNADLGRPTTPSWADFLSSGFADDGTERSPTSHHLLPPDKVLPPINTMRVHSSQSHRRMPDNDSNLEPGELASINTIDLDDSFWWVWISSLAGEEPTGRKAAFGRCALIETKITGGRWLIMEEQVKGAVPEPVPGAYIAEKKGFFSFTSRKGRLARRKSTVKKGTLKPTAESTGKHDGFASKVSIGPDQHARIQAAAAALQQKHREQTLQQQNGVRRGREDDAVSKRTNSVFTLQPVIMNEASPAMKWASQYDKNEIRAAYLGNSHAGTGFSTEHLTLPTNGLDKENVKPALLRDNSDMSRKEREKNRDLPALPPDSFSRQNSIPPPPVDQGTATPPPLPTAPVGDLRPSNKIATEAASIPLPVTANQIAAEAAAVPLPAATTLDPPGPHGNDPARPQTPVEESREEAQAAQKSSDGQRSASTTPEKNVPTHKRLTKKSRNSGIKGMFGRKKTEEAPRQASSESTEAIAAARAALEGRAKQQSPSSGSTASASHSSKANRFSGLRRKNAQPQGQVQSINTSAPRAENAISAPIPIQEEPSSPTLAHEAEAPLQTPLSSHPPMSADASDRDELSRVNTNERLQADREFSSFDQGPLAEQPAFVPADSPLVASSPEAATPVNEAAEGSTIPDDRQDESKDTGLTRTVSPVQDRWAQIRKNAAERAARQSEEQSRLSQTEKTDDGETSGEETIESRVARIKARVAELTGNMDSASSSRRP